MQYGLFFALVLKAVLFRAGQRRCVSGEILGCNGHIFYFSTSRPMPTYGRGGVVSNILMPFIIVILVAIPLGILDSQGICLLLRHSQEKEKKYMDIFTMKL